MVFVGASDVANAAFIHLKGYNEGIQSQAFSHAVSSFYIHTFIIVRVAPHKVNLFASYGVYSNSTGTISSADLELEVLDRFVKKIGVELASKPSRDSVVFIVEAATGVLVVCMCLHVC